VSSATRGWAVGEYQPSGGGANQGLTLRWNGTAWKKIALGTPRKAALTGVTSISADDAWTGGNLPSGNFAIQHWDGSSWQFVPSPQPGDNNTARIEAIDAVASDDVWAVGSYFVQGKGYKTLALHWDGSVWSRVPTPTPANPGLVLMRDVFARTANDVWATGYTNKNSHSTTMIVHWNGSTWQLSPSPNPGSQGNELGGITALTATDAWAVGSRSTNNGVKTLIARWNGSAWSAVSSPNPAEDNGLGGVAPIDADDVWSVGSSSSGFPPNADTLAVHWDGSGWSTQPAPNPGSFTAFTDIDALASGDVWVVGLINGSPDTLIAHACI